MTQDTQTTLDDIERASKLYAAKRELLAELLTKLDDELTAAKRRHLPIIKRVLGNTAEAEVKLRALIESAPRLFVKPRTILFHGLKVGYAKQKGAIKVSNVKRTVALIRKYLPKQAETLIRTVERPHKPALVLLDVADLKRVGCTVTETGDAVVIKAVDSEVDKMVDALLKGAVDADDTTERVPA